MARPATVEIRRSAGAQARTHSVAAFREEIAAPLGMGFHLRLPEGIPDGRLAPLHRPGMAALLLHMPVALTLSALNPRPRLLRCLEGSELPERSDRVCARNLEVPAGGGVGTARALARAYGVFATGGRELGLREETLRQLMAPAVPPARGFRDACLEVEIQFSLGFMKPGRRNPFAHPSAFGSPGTGGRSASPIPTPSSASGTSRTRWARTSRTRGRSPCAAPCTARSGSWIRVARDGAAHLAAVVHVRP
jgi:CubicO group peptidase (beta-lactamase class C family)